MLMAVWKEFRVLEHTTVGHIGQDFMKLVPFGQEFRRHGREEVPCRLFPSRLAAEIRAPKAASNPTSKPQHPLSLCAHWASHFLYPLPSWGVLLFEDGCLLMDSETFSSPSQASFRPFEP